MSYFKVFLTKNHRYLNLDSIPWEEFIMFKCPWWGHVVMGRWGTIARSATDTPYASVLCRSLAAMADARFVDIPANSKSRISWKLLERSKLPFIKPGCLKTCNKTSWTADIDWTIKQFYKSGIARKRIIFYSPENVWVNIL